MVVLFFQFLFFGSVIQTCKRFEIESKLKKIKDFPLNLTTTYANTLKNNATESDDGHKIVEHEKIGKFRKIFFWKFIWISFRCQNHTKLWADHHPTLRWIHWIQTMN